MAEAERGSRGSGMTSARERRDSDKKELRKLLDLLPALSLSRDWHIELRAPSGLFWVAAIESAPLPGTFQTLAKGAMGSQAMRAASHSRASESIAEIVLPASRGPLERRRSRGSCLERVATRQRRSRPGWRGAGSLARASRGAMPKHCSGAWPHWRRRPSRVYSLSRVAKGAATASSMARGTALSLASGESALPEVDLGRPPVERRLLTDVYSFSALAIREVDSPLPDARGAQLSLGAGAPTADCPRTNLGTRTQSSGRSAAWSKAIGHCDKRQGDFTSAGLSPNSFHGVQLARLRNTRNIHAPPDQYFRRLGRGHQRISARWRPRLGECSVIDFASCSKTVTSYRA